MKVYMSITLDLQRSGIPPIVQAKQNDRDARGVIVSLYDAGVPWNVPVGALALFRFKKPDGTAGFYDKLEDGKTPAITVTENTVTAIFVEQVLTAPGDVFCEINFYNSAGEKLTTFSWIVQVQASVLSDAEIISSDYYNVLSDQIAAVLKAESTAVASAKAAANSATAAQLSSSNAAASAKTATIKADEATIQAEDASNSAVKAAASATAAQGYKVQTQQLRDELHTIVVGNEAYTKQETRDKFSRALEVESPAADAQVISVEPQSDLRPRYYGFTEQAGTGDPSPTNIRPITVGGNAANLIPFPYADGMSKTVNGVAFTVQPDGGILVNGKNTSATNSAAFSLTYSNFSINNNAFLSGIKSGGNARLQVFDSKSYYTDYGNGVDIPSGAISYCLIYVQGGKTANNELIYPMLNAGNSAYPYTPYTGYDYAGLMLAQGANLIPFPYADGMSKTHLGITYEVREDKGVLCNGTSIGYSSFVFLKNFTLFQQSFLKGGKDSNCLIEAIDTRGVYYKDIGYGVVLPKKAYLSVGIIVNSGKVLNHQVVYPMLNAGTTALPYKPGIQPTNYALPSPVALPDGCSVKAGYVNADKMIVLDGSENWAINSGSATSPSGSRRFNLEIQDADMKSTAVSQLYDAFSNLFYEKTPNETYDGKYDNSFSLQGTESALGYIHIRISGISTVEQFKARLAELNAKGTPWTVYYQSTSYAGEKIPVWFVNVTKKKVVLTGTEKYSKGGHVGTLGFYVFVVTSIYNVGNGNNDEICSHFKNAKVSFSSEDADFIVDAFCTNTEASPRFIISHGKLGTTPDSTIAQCFTAAVKYIKEQYDSGTPITLTSKLATPETYAIPYTRCESPDTVNCTISTPEGTCSALYNADLKTYIGRLQSAIIALGGTI